MKTVNVLVDHGMFSTSSDFFPLYRWKNQLFEHGIKINIIHNLDSKIQNSDAFILGSRYFSSWQNITKRSSQSRDGLITKLVELKKKTENLIWFDNSDGTGSTEFEVIPFVDIFWKKQLFKDIEKYTSNTKENVRIWLPSYIQKEYQRTATYEYFACPENELNKLKIAWNIGLNDYRFSNKISTKVFSLLLPNLFNIETIVRPSKNKDIDIINRGSVFNANEVHSYQRNIAFLRLNEIKNKIYSKKIITDGFVSKSKYIKELQRSKLALSPFGWGEVCYRDFEIILAGTLMLKPSMDHLQTFPNVYHEDKYVKLNWDLSDLYEAIDNIFSNSELVADISIEARNNYIKQYNDSELFCLHFAKIIDKNLNLL